MKLGSHQNKYSMKLKLILGSLIGFASLLLLLTSCTKNMEDLKTDHDVAMLNGVGCSSVDGDYILLATLRRGASPFFWRGTLGDRVAQVTDPAKQTFGAGGFANQQFFVVTGAGGTLKYVPASESIGVNDGYINKGESVTLALSECMNGFALQSMHITLNGSEAAFATVRLYRGETLVEEMHVQGRWNIQTPGKGTSNFPVQFHAQGKPEAFFDRIVILGDAGKILFKGYQPNFSSLYYDPTYFHLVDLP